MLRFDLGNSGPVGSRPHDYMSSVTGGAYSNTSAISTATDFLKGGSFEVSDFASLLSPIPGVGQVANIVGGLFAKDDWADLKPVYESRAKVIMEYMVNTYLKNQSLSEIKRVNMFDAYVSAFLFHQHKHVGYYKHSNSKNATKLVADIIQAFLDRFRSDFSKRYNVVDKTSDVRHWGFKSYNGDPFSFRYGSLIPHKVYSFKKPKTVVTSKSSVPYQKDSLVPFNPDSNDSDSKEKDSVKYWWLLFIPFLLYVVYKAFDLNNNKKKRR